MSSTIIINLLRFFSLLILQIVLFNNIDLFGFINPFPYILYILLFPVNGNRAILLITSFLLGLSIDMFENSGGVHATACLILAYFRPSIFKFAFGISYEYQTIKIAERLSSERFSFLLISIFLHHFTLFLLEIYRLYFFWDIILRTLSVTIFTLICCIIMIYLIKPSKR